MPRFRTWTSAIWSTTSARIGRASPTSGERMSVARASPSRRSRARRRRRARSRRSSSSRVQVDEHVRRGRARLHHVDQRLAARERAAPSVSASSAHGVGRRWPAARTPPRAAAWRDFDQIRARPVKCTCLECRPCSTRCSSGAGSTPWREPRSSRGRAGASASSSGTTGPAARSAPPSSPCPASATRSSRAGTRSSSAAPPTPS